MTLRPWARALLGGTALAAAATVATPAAAQRIDNIVAFGDSYADDGNFFQIAGINPVTTQVYTTGRFSGGTNYIDTLSQLLNAPVQNFAIGGALTNNTNTNGPLPGFTFEYTSFLAGGGGVFPTVSGTFDEDDLVTVSIGGNDARFYQQTGGTLAGAPAAATASAAFATTGLDALVGAGAQTISFLAGNTALLPEVASNPAAQEIRNVYSTTFNTAVQSSLANYAASGVMVHYLDLSTVLQQIQANPEAYGITNGIACPAFPNPTCVINPSGYLVYGDGVHLTSDGYEIVGRYVAAQLQAPLTLAAPTDLALDTARHFGRTLSSRVDLGSPRDGEVAEGIKFFVVGDTFSRDIKASDATDAFDVDGVGGTIGAEFGFGNGVAGIAANYTRGRAEFGGDPARDRTRSIQVGGYAGYAVGPVFAQGYLGYGWDKHRLTRTGVVEDLKARPDGHHWTAGAKAGYLVPLASLRVGPVIGVDFAKAKVDSYTEEGDDALGLNVDEQDFKAFTGNLGIEARGDFEGGGVGLRPFVSAMLEKDFAGNGRTVFFSQTSAPTIVNQWDLGDRSKDVYGRLTGGASAAILPGASLNANVSSTFGRDDGNELSAHLGFSVGF